jgi:ribonuclease HI
MIIYCDGGSRGNPGPAASAFLIYDSNQNLLYSQGNFLGVATNNQAEYQAVLHSLKYLTNLPQIPATISYFLDSELVVKQLSGIYKIKDPNLQKIAIEIQRLIANSKSANISFNHIPRSKNSAADLLVNKTLDSN